MTDAPTPLRTDETPCLLFPELLERGGGLQKAVQERASLYARQWQEVRLLTTGFSRDWYRVPVALKERGSLHSRVRVRNFFAHSDWVSRLGVPPEEAQQTGESGVVSRPQRLRGREPFRLADTRDGQRFPFRYRYFGTDGRLLLTTWSGPESKFEQRAEGPDGSPVDWHAIVAEWVDAEIGDQPRPVLFSLQRGFNDPVLLASTRAYRKVASLHNCHYVDPEDRLSGTRPSFRTLFTQASKVDTIVCLTEQQRGELRRDVPGAHLVSIPYPGRRPAVAEDVEKEPGLVVLVGQLIDRKRVDHAVRAMVDVVAAVPGARLEVYGEGPAHESLQRLVAELGLTEVVSLMGYSTEVGRAQARACCTLMTSTFEGFARVINESMVRGTPVVSYDVRYGPRDLIRHEVDGLLVEDHRPEALAAAVVGLLREPERAAAMGRRALEVADRFPVEDFERAWTAVLTDPARRAGLRARASDLRVRARRSPTVRRLRRLGSALPRRGARPGRRAAARACVR